MPKRKKIIKAKERAKQMLEMVEDSIARREPITVNISGRGKRTRYEVGGSGGISYSASEFKELLESSRELKKLKAKQGKEDYASRFKPLKADAKFGQEVLDEISERRKTPAEKRMERKIKRDKLKKK